MGTLIPFLSPISISNRMSEEQPKKTPAQIRAEKRRARILGRGAAGASQISGDRIAPGLDFPQPGSSSAGNEEFEKQIEKIMANSTCDGTKRNLATSPNPMVKILTIKYKLCYIITVDFP